MAKGYEGKLIDKVHRQLDSSVYKMKMNMGAGAPSGVADMFYEGDKDDLFVEYKYIRNWETRRIVPMKMLTPHQITWLTRRMINNRPVGLIIGDTEGRIMWIDHTNFDNPNLPLVLNLWNPKQTAAHIRKIVMR